MHQVRTVGNGTYLPYYGGGYSTAVCLELRPFKVCYCTVPVTDNKITGEEKLPFKRKDLLTFPIHAYQVRQVTKINSARCSRSLFFAKSESGSRLCSFVTNKVKTFTVNL
jgi:hypothetical protein